MIEWLLAARVDVNSPGAGIGGGTALQAACGEGDIVAAERLLQVGADVNAPAAEWNGRTALQAAAGGGPREVVELLIPVLPITKVGRHSKRRLEAISTEVRRGPALQAAAKGGHEALVIRLLEVSADFNSTDLEDYGSTALHTAAAGGNERVEIFLAAGSRVNGRREKVHDESALEVAVGLGHLGIVKRLIAGADFDYLTAGLYWKGPPVGVTAQSLRHCYSLEPMSIATSPMLIDGHLYTRPWSVVMLTSLSNC